MRIEWSSDAAQRIIRQLEDIELTLTDCIRAAQQIRADLDEANPDQDNRRLNAITSRYERAVARLKRSAEDADELAEATQRAAVCFDDAEEQVMALINSMETVRPQPEPGARRIGDIFDIPIRDFDPSQITWPMPEPLILPNMRLNGARPMPAWLETLLDDNNIYNI